MERNVDNVDATISIVQSHGHSDRKLSPLQWASIALGAALLGLLIYATYFGDHGGHGGHAAHGEYHTPSTWAIAPFVGILLSIAVFPLLPGVSHWWEHNQNRLMVALSFAAITLTYYLVAYGADRVLQVLEHAVLADYIPFIVLLFALYVISGGICLRGDLAAHPTTNTGFLAVGALSASLIGTTGASMLLIRPLLTTNSERKRVAHTVIFFIFLVSNVGGCLLPIGDPPLFLGYLRGVPFLWTLNLWIEWAVACAILLTVYFVWDTVAYKKEKLSDIRRDETLRQPLRLDGSLNLLWLTGVVLTAATVKPGEEFFGMGFHVFPFMRELIMLGFAGLSLWTTQKAVREHNHFNYGAILEVAALFIGIFICMQIPVEILQHSGSALAPYLSSPTAFFWATGALSSFLDNAPTYVVFMQTAAAMTPETAPNLVRLADGSAITHAELVAVSLGAVFMGAMTYIGNGPNFMVRSIAEQSGVRMPSFFGYMVYSVAILIPVFLVITALFL